MRVHRTGKEPEGAAPTARVKLHWRRPTATTFTETRAMLETFAPFIFWGSIAAAVLYRSRNVDWSN